MHLLIPVFFNAPQGGLHENVRATALFMLSRRHRVTVVCRPGPFAGQLRELGVEIIETDYGECSFAATFDEIRSLHQQHPIDLIHAHPFASRRLGMITAQVLGLPCVVTMHGKYADGLAQTIDRLQAVFTVSEGIRHHLLTKESVGRPEILHVVPNTPDTKLFKRVKAAPPAESEGRLVISLVTRLDQDKAFILDVFYKALTHAAKRHSGFIHWQVVGQGTQQDTFAKQVEILRGENSVSQLGWLQGEALRDAYCSSDIVIAPGRCALEAMSCGVPVIALGSKGYNGLVDGQTWQQGVFSNFGGVGEKHAGYVEGAVERDLDRLIHSRTERLSLGYFGRQVVRQCFSASEVHRRLLGFYRLAIAACQASPPDLTDESEFLELRVRNLIQTQPHLDQLAIHLDCESTKNLQFAWYLLRDGEVIEKRGYSPDPSCEISLPGPGRYRVRCFIKDKQSRKLVFLSSEVDGPVE